MTTTTDHSRNQSALRVEVARAARRGFTLVEVMISLTIGTLVLSAATGSLLFFARSSASVGNYHEMNMTGRWALEKFASDARMTHDVNSVSATNVSLEVYDAGEVSSTIVYTFNLQSGQFIRTVEGVAEVVLEDVQSLDLKYFDHRHESTTAALEVKEIQLRAVMKRRALSVGNRNEIISARYMMRNRGVNS